MGQIKHKMGKVGGGVDISHKSKMSGKAKSLMSFPGGMPGKQDSNRVVGKGMMEYLDGQPVGIGKYKHSSIPMYGTEKGVPNISDSDPVKRKKIKKNETEKYEEKAGDGIKTVKLKNVDLTPKSKVDRMSPEEKKAFFARNKRRKAYNAYKKDQGVKLPQDEATFKRWEEKNKKKKSEGPAKKRSERLADRSQAAFDKDKVVKAKQTKAIKEGKDKKAKRLSKKRTRLQEKDIKLQRKSFEKASEGK